MAAQKYLNNFDWQLIGPVTAGTHVGFETTIGRGILQISDAASAKLGTLTGGDWYVLTLYKRSGSVESAIEVIKVLGVNEVAYSAPGECRIRVERGHESTTPETYVSGDFVSMRLTAGGLNDLASDSELAAHTGNTSNPHSVTKTQVGLGNVDNTSNATERASVATLTNKTIALGSNTVSGTLAQFNTAVTDADLVSLAGSETLTNKTIALGSNTVSGTLAQFNTAVTDADIASIAGTETLTNKTLTTPVINGFTGSTAAINIGSGQIVKDTSGNVGIGVTPSYPMDVQSNTSALGINVRGRAADGISVLRFADNANTETAAIDARTAELFLSNGSSRTPRMRIASDGTTTFVSAAMGYGAGAGGTVTQVTSKTTAVTLNKPSGQITMHNAALAAGASVTFVVNNSLAASADGVLVTGDYNGGAPDPSNYRVELAYSGTGSFMVRVTNVSAGSLSQALVIGFKLIKGATA